MSGWKPIETMPERKRVQIGNEHWTYLAERKTISGDEYLETSDEHIPFDETTATHWREYDAPPSAVSAMRG